MLDGHVWTGAVGRALLRFSRVLGTSYAPRMPVDLGRKIWRGRYSAPANEATRSHVRSPDWKAGPPHAASLYQGRSLLGRSK